MRAAATMAHIGRGAAAVPRYYFAYGSNLDPAQMAERCQNAALVGPARLAGARLTFGGFSWRWDGAVATFVEDAGAALDGVIYQVAAADVAALDFHEGHPLVYARIACTVALPNGRRRRAFTYRMKPHSRGVGPSPEYVGVIAEAYGEHGFDLAPLIEAAKASFR